MIKNIMTKTNDKIICKTEGKEQIPMLKIWRSPYSKFHSPLDVINTLESETFTADAVYTDEELKLIADNDFNGIWVHGILHNIVKQDEFPEFGIYADEQQEKLESLIRRAAKYGIKVFLFMQPPRALSGELDFWKTHKSIAGASETIDWDNLKRPTEFISLCTSTEKVQRYLRDAFASLSKALPGLGGYMIISASEYPGHCYTRLLPEKDQCPRCSKRTSSEIISELIHTIYNGMRDASATQEMIVWNWSWSLVADEKKIVANLPSDVIYMADFERGGHYPMLGHADHIIDEYALCYPGPSERFIETAEIAARHGLRIIAKLQICTTHELNSVPNLPIISNLFAKADYLRKHKVAGFLGCWSFGNMITANTSAFNFFLTKKAPDDCDVAMETFAAKYFQDCMPVQIAKAWRIFADAINHYPHSAMFLYYGPVNWALGYFVPPGPMQGKGGPSFQMSERGDDISIAFDDCEFTLDESINGFKYLSARWREGVEIFKHGLAKVQDAHSREELGIALVCGAAYRSAYNHLQLYKMKLEKNIANGEEYNKIIADELVNAEEALPWVEADKRIGFHPEAQGYLFDAPRIKAKILKLRQILKIKKEV